MRRCWQAKLRIVAGEGGALRTTVATSRWPRRVLLVYYSHRRRKVLEAAGGGLPGAWVKCTPHDRVHRPRYAQRFSRFPMEHTW